MNTSNNKFLLYLHMTSNHPDYIEEHAILVGKLASGQIDTIDEYIKECNVQGINCYAGGDSAKRYFGFRNLHKANTLVNIANYDEYLELCRASTIIPLYTTENGFEYAKLKAQN